MRDYFKRGEAVITRIETILNCKILINAVQHNSTITVSFSSSLPFLELAPDTLQRYRTFGHVR